MLQVSVITINKINPSQDLAIIVIIYAEILPPLLLWVNCNALSFTLNSYSVTSLCGLYSIYNLSDILSFNQQNN